MESNGRRETKQVGPLHRSDETRGKRPPAGAARADFNLPADVAALDFGAAVSDMAGSLRRAPGVVVRVVDTNLSARKSYFRKYQDLRRRARDCPEYAAMVRAQYRPCFSNVPTARARQAPAP